MSSSEYDALRVAVGDAVHAPSIFNTQPWLWRVDRTAGLALELYADPARKLAVVDPSGTLLLLSVGAALHHARVSLAAHGWRVDVARMVAGAHGPAVARLALLDRGDPDPVAVRLRAAIPLRRTDRRPYGDVPVPARALAAAAAATAELASPRYRIELMQWTNRPEWAGDGVPPQTSVRQVPRRVPVRAFALPSATLASRAHGLSPEEGMPVAPGGDQGAAFLVLHGPGEEPMDWVRAGEALSAVLLTAVHHGLAGAPFTDVLEVDHPRDLVRGLLPGPDRPYVVVRCGYSTGVGGLPDAPRRAVAEVLRDEQDRVAR